MVQKAIITNGYKTVSALNLDSDVGWNILGGPRNDEKVTDATLYHRVPWLKRGMDCIGDAVSSMPFVILQGEQEIDNSKDYKNEIEFMPSPRMLMGKIAVALTMLNQAYLLKLQNPNSYTKGLRYIRPDSISLLYDKREDGSKFVGLRREGQGVNGKDYNIDLTAKDPYRKYPIVAFWRSDMYTEFGPTPEASPAQAAIAAAGVLYHKDKFIASYFERGAIKVTILAADTNDKSEAESLKHWWQDVVGGIKNAWTAFVVRAKQIVPTVIGGGLDELKENGLTAQAREDIATALGIPQSKLFSSAAAGLGGGGVKDADDIQFYRETIIPLCWIIQDTLNEQLFKPEGYMLKFTPEALDIFSPNRVEQAQSMKLFNDWLTTCATKEIALATAAQFNYALTDDLQKAIAAWFDQKAERTNALVENLTKPKETPPATQAESQPAQEETTPPEDKALAADLDKWKRKATKALAAGKSAAVDFVSEVIPADMRAVIAERLACAKTIEDVTAAFVVEDTEPVRVEWLEALQKANSLLERALVLEDHGQPHP